MGGGGGFEHFLEGNAGLKSFEGVLGHYSPCLIMWKINICKIPCLNTSGILPGNTTFSYHQNKIMITYRRKHILECTILSSLLLMKRLIRVEVLLVILVGSFISCVSWYTSRILMRHLVWESPGLNRLQQLISPVL